MTNGCIPRPSWQPWTAGRVASRPGIGVLIIAVGAGVTAGAALYREHP